MNIKRLITSEIQKLILESLGQKIESTLLYKRLLLFCMICTKEFIGDLDSPSEIELDNIRIIDKNIHKILSQQELSRFGDRYKKFYNDNKETVDNNTSISLSEWVYSIDIPDEYKEKLFLYVSKQGVEINDESLDSYMEEKKFDSVQLNVLISRNEYYSSNYHPDSNQINISIKTNWPIDELVDTLTHELSHFYQNLIQILSKATSRAAGIEFAKIFNKKTDIYADTPERMKMSAYNPKYSAPYDMSEMDPSARSIAYRILVKSKQEGLNKISNDYIRKFLKDEAAKKGSRINMLIRRMKKEEAGKYKDSYRFRDRVKMLYRKIYQNIKELQEENYPDSQE